MSEQYPSFSELVAIGEEVMKEDRLNALAEALEFVIRQARIIAYNPEGSFVKTVAEAIERKCNEALKGRDMSNNQTYNPDCDSVQDASQAELDEIDRPSEKTSVMPSIEDAKEWKRDNAGYFVSPDLENYVAKLMSDYAMEVLGRSGYFDGRDYEGEI